MQGIQNGEESWYAPPMTHLSLKTSRRELATIVATPLSGCAGLPPYSGVRIGLSTLSCSVICGTMLSVHRDTVHILCRMCTSKGEASGASHAADRRH